ncbi:hypothetical protein LEP1GSC013_3955 [Leptospira interrogans serovar Valbuzzi str. Duyster]|nr:hypothetical protein LEP1GSC013_3955 [Leptospira interrogans serovar Valbuzzi str. Duyster]ENO74085.1 hypothetical protein LEP1GSC012_0472 [Leptospira interrogans serovar Valbuzzi str. Valbuzzi]
MGISDLVLEYQISLNHFQNAQISMDQKIDFSKFLSKKT